MEVVQRIGGHDHDVGRLKDLFLSWFVKVRHTGGGLAIRGQTDL